jgi:apolipoprotein N-acyltransferase
VDLEWLRATAALGGSFLMSFLVALGSATVAVVLTRPRGDVFASALAAVATIGACVAWSAGHPPVTGRSVRVAAVTVEVPPNIAQRWYDEHVWLSADLWSVFERYEAATRKAAAAGAELVAWREYGLAVPGDQRERFDERVRALAEETDMVVVASFIDGDEYRNLALLAAPDGQTDLYAKQHLVPALESFWLEPGTRDYGWLEYGDLRIAALICYDIDFGASVRKAARHGANLLVVPAADWPGIHERHPLQGSLRAAEHSIPLVRPARGLSVLIDAAGGIVASAPDTDTLEVILVDELALGGSPTAYTAAGNWVVVLAVLVLAASWVQQRRRRPPVNESL